MRAFLKSAFRLAAVMLCVFCGATSGLSQTLYVTGLGNEFGTLNPTTGAFNSIGMLALPAGDYIYGMGFTSTGLYGLDSDPDANLWRIDPSTAALTPLGAVGESAAGATAGANNTLLAISQDVNAIYYSLKPPSASSSVTGPTGLSADGLVAFGGGVLYMGAPDPSLPTDDLYTVNLSTGSATLVGSIGYQGVTAGIFLNGELYGFTSNDQILSINTSTGAGAFVSSYNLPGGDTILSASLTTTPASVPEAGPQTMGLSVSAFWLFLLAAARTPKVQRRRVQR